MAGAKRADARVKKKVKKNIPEGIVFIYSTFNNTIVTISDRQGNVISWWDHEKGRRSLLRMPWLTQRKRLLTSECVRLRSRLKDQDPAERRHCVPSSLQALKLAGSMTLRPYHIMDVNLPSADVSNTAL